MFKLSQYSNAETGILVTRGSSIVFNERQDENALRPKLVTLGNFTVISLEQLLNADSPIDSTLEISNSVIPVRQNAELLIANTFGRIILPNFWQPSNAIFKTRVTLGQSTDSSDSQ